MVDKVLMPLANQAGKDGHLYWRIPEKIELTQITFEEEDKPRWLLRTRLAVMTKDYEVVRADDAVKPNDTEWPKIEDEQT